MKYVRTKDGRITTIKDEWMDNPGLWVLGGKENILKISDTIEELCDEIIGILNKNIECERYETSLRIGDKLWFDDLEDAEYNKKYCSEIYGAIWTSKGLIYVAKMNEKGELELI